MSNPLFIKAPFLTRKNFFNTNKTNNVFCLTNTYKQILGYRKYIYFTFLFRYFIFIVVLHYCNLFYFVATKITTNLHYFSIKTRIF